MEIRFILGLFMSAIVAYTAYRRESLTKDGMAAACLVGTIIFTFGSFYWYGLLLSFFISSTLLSKYRKNQKKKVEDLFAKTGRRDFLQVLANGGVGALITVVNYFYPSPGWMLMFLGILSTVNADTWGTEIGVLSKTRPVHVLTWKRVEKGSSGGISGIGSLATILGALFIGVCAMVFDFVEHGSLHMIFLVASLLGGVAGAMADSVLGATVQNMYRCLVCNQETEKPSHCGMGTQRIRGFMLVNNDVVNLLSSLIGGALAWAMYI